MRIVVDNEKKEDAMNQESEFTEAETAQQADSKEQDHAKEEQKADTENAENKEDAKDTADEETKAQNESGFFKKKAKADKKHDALKQKIDELEDKTKRQMAEFENFRKRTEKEKSAMFETGAKSILEKILPVIDNFERGLNTVAENEKDTPFTEGMNMVYKQLMSELEAMGVAPIKTVGEEFNPDLHNAVMQVESEEYESGIIAQEMLKGYLYRDIVIRHSMVAVVS